MAEAESPPSPWLVGHGERLRQAARRGPVLDVACGRGRHGLAALRMGAHVVAIDRDAGALAALRRRAKPWRERLLPVRADLETHLGIPVRAGSCGAILVFRFLFRPLVPALVEALAPGGLLLYETFTIRQRDLPYGPRNEAFLLAQGELRTLFPELELLAYEEGGPVGSPGFALAKLAARKALPSS